MYLAHDADNVLDLRIGRASQDTDDFLDTFSALHTVHVLLEYTDTRASFAFPEFSRRFEFIQDIKRLGRIVILLGLECYEG